MADGIMQIPPDSTGKKIDTETLTVGANTVHRERVQIAGAAATEIASVSTAGALLVDNAELPAAAALADAAANPTTTLVGACLHGFNGTTWDRVYTVADGDAIAAGTKGFVILGHDGSAYQVLATDASGNLQVDVVTGGGGTPTTDTDDDSITAGQVVDLGASLLYGFNGVTWERVTTDGAGNLDVNIAASAVLLVDATGQGDVPITLAGEIVVADVTGQGDVPITLAGETVVLAAGASTIGSIASVTTSVTPGTAAANLGKAVNVASADGDTGVAVLAIRDDVPGFANAEAEGDYVPLRVGATGQVFVDATAAGDVPITLAGEIVVADVTGQGDVPITLAGEIVVADVTGQGDVPITLGGELVAAQGDVAHDAVDSGNPIKVGYKALAHGANPTAVAAADRTDSYANRHGVPWVIGGHPNVISREVTVLDSDGAQTNAAIVTIGASTKIVVTRLSVLADNANTVDVAVRIGFGTATLGAAALAGVNGILLSHPGIAAGSGVVEGVAAGILGVGADNEDLRYTCDDPAGGSLTIIVSYYTVES